MHGFMLKNTRETLRGQMEPFHENKRHCSKIVALILENTSFPSAASLFHLIHRERKRQHAIPYHIQPQTFRYLSFSQNELSSNTALIQLHPAIPQTLFLTPSTPFQNPVLTLLPSSAS